MRYCLSWGGDEAPGTIWKLFHHVLMSSRTNMASTVPRMAVMRRNAVTVALRGTGETAIEQGEEAAETR